MTDSENFAHENSTDKNEHRFFDLSAEMLAIASTRDGLLKRVNPAFCNAFGWSGQELVKKHYLDLVHPDDLEKSQRTIADTSPDKLRTSLENRICCKHGGYKRIVWRIAQFPSEGLIYCVGKERKKADEEPGRLNETFEKRMNERASRAEARTKQLQTLAVELIEAEERERRRFAKFLHDDLQQILAAARLQLSAVREDMPELTALETVELLIRESIRKARGLSHDLSPAVLHHSGLIAALKWLARHMWEHFGLQVDIEVHDANDFENSAFKVFMFRAVRELLFNVVKHADTRMARIGLSGTEKALTLDVSDEGKGFDPEIPLSCDVQAGLGLISLRERALAIGGELVMESAPGLGSRFTLTVPLIRAKIRKEKDSAPADEPRIASPPAFKVSSAEEDIRVLFADDHQVMRQGLIELLTGQPKIEVIGEAASGKEALELTRRLKPDVVLMDVSMPEMDGIEATRHIKKEFPEVRVIGLTMFDGEQMARRMLNAGVEAFVSKTASSSELLRAIYGIGRQRGEGH